MAAQRHTLRPADRSTGRAGATAADGDAVLRAARDCVMDVGIRRTTLADVARRAGVSRMTVYRRWGDLDALVSALLTAELLAVVESAADEVAELPTARERLVEAAVLVVGRTAAHPLWRRVLDLEPELLLPLVVDRLGSTQRAAVDHVTVQLRAGQSDGSVRADLDPELGALCVLMTAQSFVFSARVVERHHDPVAAAGELRRLLDGYLR